MKRLGYWPAALAAFAMVWVLAVGPALVAGSVETTSEQSLGIGQRLYTENCARCHGANLEGQPDWQSRLPSGRVPAPPHDASGHTWHHPDGVLFRITWEGPAAVVGGGYESDMPGFADILDDDEIRAVLTYIKSTWPERERAYQAEISRNELEQ